ncbi:hypothetical protein [Acetobacter fallax]|uniref:Cobalt transporter n=1 Tax=Acetobacter fallax TaxID=1737473 RepID=A0ABX0KBJ5_9PROT|nr:hypothetical protein [Acetobacter fallax]NHO33775.1 hypothetical protein [Acetobacter fallax]NHO37336.1 hypothetical protein [Acetobacter fallax]
MHSLTLVLAAAAIGLGFAASEHISSSNPVAHEHVRHHAGAPKAAASDGL